MKKHNATYYNNKIQRLRDRIAEKEKRLQELETVLESDPANVEAGDEWEKVYHEISPLRKKLRDVKFRRDTQDWDCEDWYYYGLSCENRD